MSLSFINHSLVWTWTLALSKMNVVSETPSLPWLSVNLLLVCQRLFELHLLLHLLLFVS
jgi:hypothetical protein